MPSTPTALTSTVWDASESGLIVKGEVQAAQAPPSVRHSKVAPDSVEVKLTDGVLVVSGVIGAELMLVSGRLGV